MTEAGLDDDDNIYEDLDPVILPKATPRCDNAQTGTDDWMDYADVLMLQNPTATLTSRLESDRKKLEMDLLLEFVADEGSSRKSNLKMDPEFQELQKEVLRLQNLNSQKDVQISELTTQNINLKRNISSLYKTAKSEVEQKDLLLADANRRLEKTFFHRNRLPYRRDQYSQTVNSSSDAPEKGSSMKSNKDIIDSKESDLKQQNLSTTRKRLLSSDKDETSAGCENPTKAKQSRIDNCDSVAPTTSNDCKEQSVEQATITSTSTDCKEQSVELSPGSSSELSNSQDTDGTSNNYFDMLPDTVKRSFLEYELSQIESLNRLKQSFIEHYFVQAKIRPHGSGDRQPSPKPDEESAGSVAIALQTSSSSSMKETDDLNCAKEQASGLVVNHENGGNSKAENSENSFPKPFDKKASCSSINKGSVLNGSKEKLLLSPTNHQDKANLKSERTQSSAELGNPVRNCNKVRKCPSSKAINLPEAYLCDVAKLYRQRKEKLPILLKRQIYNHHKKTKEN